MLKNSTPSYQVCAAVSNIPKASSIPTDLQAFYKPHVWRHRHAELQPNSCIQATSTSTKHLSMGH